MSETRKMRALFSKILEFCKYSYGSCDLIMSELAAILSMQLPQCSYFMQPRGLWMAVYFCMHASHWCPEACAIAELPAVQYQMGQPHIRLSCQPDITRDE
jgi:hypothetical protein